MKILVLDNYDSFTYNLVHIVREFNYPVEVFRNDKIEIENVNDFDKILISPGPGIPDEAGIMKQVIERFGPHKSILGVCLGHQGIAEVYGAGLYNMPNVLHGIITQAFISDEHDYLFRDLPQKFRVTHYHSWAVNPDSIPVQLKVTAVNEAGLVMAISHRDFDVKGVQFHPESVMTEHGKEIVLNWLRN